MRLYLHAVERRAGRGACISSGKDAILSGPAGGIVGAARTAAMAGFERIIGFDMGGTSTDVALYAGAFERAFETEVAGVRLRAPMMAINTVAAGGGSILHFDGARLRVGPDSAGADPGPACYRRGGPLTVTDANVCVGKIQPAHFPAIFGPDGDQPLDAAIVREKFAALADEIARRDRPSRRRRASVAEGFLRIAVANMANAIKQVSVQKGHDATRFALACFGGAGGQHACLVADELGMETVLIHPLAGVLSAYGMGLADQTALREQAVELPLSEATLPRLQRARRHAGGAGIGGAARAGRRCVAASRSSGACICAMPAPRRRCPCRSTTRRHSPPPSPKRTAPASASPPPTARWSSRRWRWRRRCAGEPVLEHAPPPRTAGAPAPVDRIEMWSGGAAHATPGVRPRGAAARRRASPARR